MNARLAVRGYRRPVSLRRVPGQGGPLTPPAAELSQEARELLDAAACGLVQTSDDGTFLRANRTFCQWLGIPAETLVGRRRFQDLLTMGGRVFHQTHWAPLLRMQGSLSEVKLELVHADGSKIPMVLNAIRRPHAGANVHEIAAYVAHDRDKYERELLLSRKRFEDLVAEATRHQAEAKDRAVFAEQMIGIVSHDLRNPLAAVHMAAAVLARGELSPAQQRLIGSITRSTERATRLIADLLDFTQARLGAGLPVERRPIDLHETVEEAVEELRLLYPDRTLEFRRTGGGACTADANRLIQLIGNLVSNAMTYGARAAPVTVHSTIEAASFAIAVHNLGPTIAPEAQATLFQPMTRGTHEASASRSVGLGLFIVREIARAHGGTTFVQSTPEAGTTVGATFPRA
jgi:sigma-B regulation protein RsbU (phosphoserine phosphatase)